jgi:hypothetical protein
MIHIRIWTAVYPAWMKDDLSYYLHVRFHDDRAVDQFGNNSPYWVYWIEGYTYWEKL